MVNVDRFYPGFVSALGSAGLGTAFAYFIGVALVFQPGWEEWARFFLVWGPPVAFVPGLMLIAHLYLRTHLGRWWVERGAHERAIEYTEQRLGANLLRSRKETLYHRIYLARAQIGRAAYAAAMATLTEGYSVPESGREASHIRRWILEAELRRERGAAVEEAYQSGVNADPPQSVRAALDGARAEWAVLEGSPEAYHTHLERGRWADEESPRVDLAEGFGAIRFGRDHEAYREGLRLLESSRDRVDREVPARAAEIDAVRAQLLDRLDRREEARKVLEEARSVRADARAERRIEHVAAQLDGQID
jgi:tetratricopeptide (TPR) repeat protein